MKIKYSLFSVLLLVTVASAQIPDAPSAAKAKQGNIWLSPLKDPAFYIGVGNHTASAIVDTHTTQTCIANKTCAEAYPGHERYSYIVPLIALETAAQYGCSLMFSNHKKWRWSCLGISAAMSFYHWKDSFTIYPNKQVATR